MRLAIINVTGGSFSGGYRKYLINIVPRLAVHPGIKHLICIFPKNEKNKGWIKRYIPVETFYFDPYKLLGGLFFTNQSIKKIIKRFSPDVIFIPTEKYIGLNGIPVVNMVRNMEPFIFPALKGDSIRDIIRNYILRFYGRIAIKRANHTIAVSRYVSDYLINDIGIQNNKVSIIHHGIDIIDETKHKIPEKFSFLSKNEFLFTCGSIRPARGLEDLLEAAKILYDKGLKFNVLIAGETTPGAELYKYRLQEFIEKNNLINNILWAGNLTEEELNWCYKNCKAFVMTSRVEACPNVALEAMANGAIIISANNPPLPEFFLNYAFYYEPYDANSLAKAINNSINLREIERNELSMKVKKRSKDFSWDVTVDKLIETLMMVVEKNGKNKIK